MGGSIIEFIVFLAASAILTVVGIQNDIAKKHSQMLTAEGYNEAAIVHALGTYLTEQSPTLLAGHNGGDTVTAPTLAELNLKNSYATGPFWGGAYDIALAAAPVGCTYAAGNCHVAFQFYPSMPYTRMGVANVADVAQIAAAANTMDAQFGYSSVKSPATISGINGAWSAPNPLGSAPATLMATNDGGSGDNGLLYIRRDGSLTWTGDQNVNGVSLHNVNSIDATGTIAAPTLSASNVAVSNAVMTPGTLQVENATGTAPAPINTGAATVNGNANVTGMLTLGNIAVPEAACSPNGSQAAEYDGSGLMFQCYMGAWVPMGGRWQLFGEYVVSSGTTVPAPTCSAGATPKILLNVQSFYVDTTAAVNFGPATGTGPWTINITDGQGASIQGNGEATTYCVY
jgi:hypothetical protein